MNDERRRSSIRSQGTDQAVRASCCADVRGVAEDGGGTSSGEAGAAFGDICGANYREAHRSRSKAEFIAKVGDCLKELDETAYWLELLTESNIVPAQKLTSLQDETHQLLAILTTISKRTKDGPSSS